MNTTYRIDPPNDWRPKHRKPMSQETSGLIAAALIYVVLTGVGIVMTAVS